MNVKRLLGIVLAVAGFAVPFFLYVDGLTFAGHIALSIFLMAAMLWMFEPVPIYATSLLVIFLGILLLSAEGPVYSSAELPVAVPLLRGEQLWEVPSQAVEGGDRIYAVIGENETTVLGAEVLERRGATVLIRSGELTAAMRIAADSRHPLVGYTPNHYSDYFNTLANAVIILFLGGLLMAEAAVKYNLDKNISRIVLKPFAGRPATVVLGLLLVTAMTSALMSNTAATAMMMTVILPIVARLPKADRFRTALVLAIPVGANLGGITTPIGSPPNAVALAALVKQGILIPFGTWVVLALPLVLLSIFIAWRLLLRFFPPAVERFDLTLEGSFDRSPRGMILYVIAGVTVLLWMTEALHGLSSSIVAFFAVTALSVTGVVEKSDIRRLPWEVLWLVAGGIALNVAMSNTGLTVWFVDSIEWGALGWIGVLVLFSLVGLLLSQFLSHTICATILMPLVISVAEVQSGDGSLPVTLSALVVGIVVSFAMALPIATPPNAIAVSTGLVKTPDMARVGIAMGVVGLVLVLLLAESYWALILR